MIVILSQAVSLIGKRRYKLIMKICRRGLYVQIIDGIGTVRACAYSGYNILGNLRDNSLEEVYGGEEARKFQQSLINHTYEYCTEENCPIMQNGAMAENLVEIDKIPTYPSVISLGYDRRCNYKCTCCCSRGSEHIRPEYEDKIEKEIKKALPYVKELSANGLGEFFCSDSMIRLVNEWNPIDEKNAIFSLETNASLFNEKNWERICHVGKFKLRVTITVMSYDEGAYQFLSGTKLGIDNILNNLKFVKSLRDKEIINFLEIATVVQERNFRSLPNFVERSLNEFGADQVRVRRFLPEKAMDENIEWFFDVRNPLHPYHQEYLEVMKHPIFKDSRVFKWTGDSLSNRGDIPARAALRVMNKLFLIENAGEKLGKILLDKGYEHIVLYAIGNLCKAVIQTLMGQSIKIDYIIDAHTHLTEFQGYEIKKATNEVFAEVNAPILVTLAARHNEMDEYIRHRGFNGTILSLEELLGEID